MPCVTPPPASIPQLAVAAARLGEAFAAAPLEELLVDYTRLFLGPVDTRAKPYGSVWLDDDAPLMGDSTMAVLQHYEDGGFEVDEGFRDLPDHVAVELEFLYVLLFRLADASMRGDEATLRGADTMRRRFLAEHLGRVDRPICDGRSRRRGKRLLPGAREPCRALRGDGGRSQPVCLAPRAGAASINAAVRRGRGVRERRRRPHPAPQGRAPAAGNRQRHPWRSRPPTGIRARASAARARA